MGVNYSVIIPAYNAEKTIARCLDSLLKQVGDQAEIIVVDDGSLDRTGDIVKEYSTSNKAINYVYQKNAGVSCARNKGLEIAKGTYITFVDSDDYVSADYFKNLSDIGQADLALFSHVIINNGVEIKRYEWGDSVRGSLIDKICGILFSRRCSPWNKRYKYSIIKENNIRFDPRLYLGEDFLFNLAYMLKCKTIESTDAAIYYVDEGRTDSLTRKIRQDYFRQPLTMYKEAFSIVQTINLDRTDVEQLMQTLDYIFCRTTFACAEDVIEGGDKKVFSKIEQITRSFSEVKCGHVKSINIIHFFMQLVLEKKVCAGVYIVAKMHTNLKKKGSKS